MCVLSDAMTSKRTRQYLYAFIISQPLVLILLGLDQGLGVIDVPRRVIHIFIALPWGTGILALIATLRELGLSVGHDWAHWILAVALVYGVQFYSVQEIYLDYIAPVNLVVFPILTLLLSHIDMRERF